MAECSSPIIPSSERALLLQVDNGDLDPSGNVWKLLKTVNDSRYKMEENMNPVVDKDKPQEDEDELKRVSMDSTKTTEDEDEALNLYKDLVEKSTGNNGKKDAFHMDGDYLILIEARKQRKATSVEPTLWNLLEGNDENFIPARTVVNKSREELKAIADGISAEQTRLKIFEIISSKDLNNLQQFFSDKKSILINLTSACYRDPNSATTALHHAIDCEAWNIATFLIQKSAQQMVTESFSLKIDGSHTYKTALHQLSEKGNTDLVQTLLKKLSDKAAIKEFLHRTTLVKAAGQRPREMMCLHIAALFGHNDLVKHYLSLGIEPDITNPKNDTPLLWAVRGGHLNIVNTFLEQNCDVNHENDKGSTPLYWSVRYGHTDILVTLIKSGKADVNKRRKMGFVTPIILASAMGYAEMVNILSDHGANVNITIRNGETALQHAASEGNQACVKNLIVHGADVNAADEAGNTPLTLAAKHQHAAVTYLLASAGANLDHVSHEGKSVWHYAIESSTNDVLIGLVEYMRRSSEFFIHGIENIVQFPVGKTPLHIAAEKGDFDKVKCLLNLGVDRSSEDEHGNNFLHIAAKHNNKLIIKTYGDKEKINKKNSDGDTVLLIACKGGNFEAAFAALKHAKADDVNIQKETALHLVAKNPDSEPAFVEKLVNVMIKKHSWTVLDSPDEKGNTALHVAAMHAKPGVIESLHYLDIKATNQNGDNPLHIATRRGDWDVFEAFLTTFGGRGKSLDYDQQNNAGESLLHIAAEKRNIQRVKELILAGTDVDIQDSDGNTVLHTIIIDSAVASCNHSELLDVFMTIIDNCVWWWCVKNHVNYPSDDVIKYNSLKRDAVLFVLTAVKNKDDVSALQLAAQIGAKEILECILNIREVFRFRGKPGYVKYDVTHLTPDTLLKDGVPKYSFGDSSTGSLSHNGKVKHFDVKPDTENPDTRKCDPSEPIESLVETIVHTSDLTDISKTPEVIANTVRILDITPLNRMVGNYWSKYQWAYALLMFVHILYMSLFSAFIADWLPKSSATLTRLDENNNTLVVLVASAPQIWPTILTLTWPIILIIYGMYSIFVGIFYCSRNRKKSTTDSEHSTLNIIVSLLMHIATNAFGVLFALFVVTWFALYALEDTAYQDFIVSIALILGWLYSIQFTKGFRNVHHFSLMLRQMIIRDILKFFLLYSFVLLGFTMAFHALFQASAPRVSDFPTVFHSGYFVYNIMIGMADFAENVPYSDFETIGKTTGFIRIVYIVYTILSNIVLLNLLIALMNDSYSTISAEQANNWRVNSVLLALDIEKEIPILPKIFYALRRQNNMFFDASSKRWYISLPIASNDAYADKRELSDDGSRSEQIKRIEDKVMDMEEKINKVDENLQKLVKQLSEHQSKNE